MLFMSINRSNFCFFCCNFIVFRVYFGNRGGKIYVFNRLTQSGWKLNKISEINIEAEFRAMKGVNLNKKRIFHYGVRSIDSTSS